MGMERFEALPRSYFRQAHVVVIVFNTCKRRSFEGVKKWIDTTLENASADLQVIFIIGLKQNDKTKDCVTE
jgi:GTPase SAR1 family protein